LITETVIKMSSNCLSMGENEDKDKIQDNKLNGSEFIKHTCKQKRKCPIQECNIVTRHLVLKNYCNMLLDLQLQHIEEDS
ncbi:12201_t:CDS:1, partial [Gigaspora margarita]